MILIWPIYRAYTLRNVSLCNFGIPFLTFDMFFMIYVFDETFMVDLINTFGELHFD